MLARILARGITHLLPLVLLSLAACGSNRLAIEYDYDGDADFASLHTWSWIPTQKSGAGSEEVNAIIREALTSQLAQRGYRHVESGGDFLAGFMLETKRKITRRYVDSNFGYGSMNPYMFDGIGGVDVVVEDYLQGTLILDVAAQDGKQPIWRGWAEGVIREDMSEAKMRAEVTEAIRGILEKFPPPATRKKSRKS